MQVKDAIRLLATENMDDEIIIAWWGKEGFEDSETEEGDEPITQTEWTAFCKYASEKMDWSGSQEDIACMFENWKEEQEDVLDNTTEPLLCPRCDADLGEVDTTYGIVHTDHNIAWRDVTCGDCDTTWTERYTFDHFVIEE